MPDHSQANIFDVHPSQEMVALFKDKPFQGQSPEKASIIFLSSDANYSPEISNHPFFNFILEYQKNGIAFWKKYDCHHPFLLSNYPFNKNTGGVPFHRNFRKIGLSTTHIENISFLELLDIPTIGNKSKNKKLFYDLVSKSHLAYIENLMMGDSSKLFFVSNGVLKDIEKLKKRFPVFKWLDLPVTGRLSKGIKSNKIEEIYHFSSWQIHGQLAEISTIINKWLEKSANKSLQRMA